MQLLSLDVWMFILREDMSTAIPSGIKIQSKITRPGAAPATNPPALVRFFERTGRFEDQDMILIVSDGEPKPLKKRQRRLA
ncbi:unnamed protein product [Arctogadus glacialis]